MREILTEDAPDSEIARRADQMSAIVATWDRDFKRLARRVPEGNRRLLRQLGRISFQCREDRGRRRAEQLIESIEFEYDQVQKQSDKRLFMRINESSFLVER